jgi:hypothetical protein
MAGQATLSEQVSELKRRFGLSRVVLVGDRSMITSARIGVDLRATGLDWISCLGVAWRSGDGVAVGAVLDSRKVGKHFTIDAAIRFSPQGPERCAGAAAGPR